MSHSANPETSGPTAPLDEPLGLTVHSLPNPSDALGQDGKRTSTGRWKMMVVMLVCAAPVIASYFTYYVVRPEGRRNFGDLIEPQRSLPNLVATGLNGKPVNLKTLKGQWLLVAVGSGACDESCAHNLYLQRQLHTSLGKEKDRVDRVWLISDDQPVDDKLRTAIGDATILRLPAQALATWLQAAAGQRLDDHLYLVDSLGNWMMRFPAKLDLTTAAKSKRDIERLLRASAFWDTPGR